MGALKPAAASLPLLSTNPCPLLLTNQNGSGVSIGSGGNVLFAHMHENAAKRTLQGFRSARARQGITAGGQLPGRGPPRILQELHRNTPQQAPPTEDSSSQSAGSYNMKVIDSRVM